MRAAPFQALPGLRRIRHRMHQLQFGAELTHAAQQLHPWLSCARVSKSIHAAPDGTFLYVAVAKNASSAIRAALRNMQGAPQQKLHKTTSFPPLDAQKHDGQFLLSLIDLGAEKFASLLSSPDCLKFAFVRNPYLRLASAWANKIQPLAPNPAIHPNYAARLRRSRRGRLRRLFGWRAQFMHKVSFETFAKQVCRQNPLYHDVHWIPQTSQLYTHAIRYDFIGHIESLDEDFRRLTAQLGKKTALPQLNQTAAPPLLDELYTPNLREMVYQTYQSDFKSFGYPPELPTD